MRGWKVVAGRGVVVGLTIVVAAIAAIPGSTGTPKTNGEWVRRVPLSTRTDDRYETALLAFWAALAPRHLERLDAPILGAVQRPLATDRLHRGWSWGIGKRDVHLVDDALEVSTIVLAAHCTDRHLSARSSFAQHKR